MPARAAEALVIMTGAMLAAGVGLIPELSSAAVCAIIMTIGACIAITSAITQIRAGSC